MKKKNNLYRDVPKKPSVPDGYKQFGKAVTKLSAQELDSIFNAPESDLDKKAEAEMTFIQIKFSEWWAKYGDSYCAGCATNSEADGIKQAAEAAFEIGYGEGFSNGKFGP